MLAMKRSATERKNFEIEKRARRKRNQRCDRLKIIVSLSSPEIRSQKLVKLKNKYFLRSENFYFTQIYFRSQSFFVPPARERLGRCGVLKVRRVTAQVRGET